MGTCGGQNFVTRSWSTTASLEGTGLNLFFEQANTTLTSRDLNVYHTSLLFHVSFFMHLVSPSHAHGRSTDISIAGPYIGFAGALWTDLPHLQVLAPVLPLFYHHTDVEIQERAACYFGAAKKAINGSMLDTRLLMDLQQLHSALPLLHYNSDPLL